MTDRELLELAAKAAGINGSWCENVKCIVFPHGRGERCWIPLEDDSDAFRLAVKLRLCLFLEIPRIGIGPNINGSELYLEDGEDEYAATRRAIVLAAAEIGKANAN